VFLIRVNAFIMLPLYSMVPGLDNLLLPSELHKAHMKKRRFRAGLRGGMFATGVPPPVHGVISRGSGINGARGRR